MARQNLHWENYPLGRRIIERLAGGRMRLYPGVVPEVVTWLRIIGNYYVKLMNELQASRRTTGDAFLNATRQTTEFRINLIQDLITQTCDQFGRKQFEEAWQDTCLELDITDNDTNPELFVPVTLCEDGEGI